MSWSHPVPHVATVVICGLLVGYALFNAVYGAVYGKRSMERLAWERVARPDALTRRYRRRIVRLAGIGGLAVLAPVVDPGVSFADVGLTSRPAANGELVVYVVAVVAAVGVRLTLDRARRARGAPVRGGRIQQRLAPMQPVTRSERWHAVTLSVAAGVGEETAYRGLLLATLVGVFHVEVLTAALIGMAIFGVAHLYQGVRGAVGATVLGAFFTVLYLGSGTIWTAVVFHALWNVMALLVAPRLYRTPVPPVPIPVPPALNPTHGAAALRPAAPLAAE